jgi:group I intron endonuclease
MRKLWYNAGHRAYQRTGNPITTEQAVMTSPIIDTATHLPQCAVYAITCTVNGKVYCGNSSRLELRRQFHLWQLRNGLHHNPKLQKDFDIFGENNFVLSIIQAEEDFGKRTILENDEIVRLKAIGMAYNKTEASRKPKKNRTRPSYKSKTNPPTATIRTSIYRGLYNRFVY